MFCGSTFIIWCNYNPNLIESFVNLFWCVDVAGVTQILGGYSSTLEHSFQTMGGQSNIDQNENYYEEKTSEIPMAPVPNERKEENG